MTGRLAILSGQGRLPVLLARDVPDAFVVSFATVPVADDLNVDFCARFEEFGALFDALRAAGVERVVFAGGMTRPELNPAAFDTVTRGLAPRIAAAMTGGDDGLLRCVVGIFEEEGFIVLGAHQALDGATARAGALTGASPDPTQRRDAMRARDILLAIGTLDVAQGCVVAGGLCLGLETAQGTEAMLRFVAQTRAPLRPDPGGVLVKRAKTGQDLRIDMPAIGPDTVDQAVAAGLTGLCIEAGRTLLLDRAEILRRADRAGLILWSEE